MKSRHVGLSDPEKAIRDLAGLHAAPALLFGRQQQVLIERIRGNGDLDPFAAHLLAEERRPKKSSWSQNGTMLACWREDHRAQYA